MHIVWNNDRGGVIFQLHLQHQVADFFRCDRIETCCWFVIQHDERFQNKRTQVQHAYAFHRITQKASGLLHDTSPHCRVFHEWAHPLPARSVFTMTTQSKFQIFPQQSCVIQCTALKTRNRFSTGVHPIVSGEIAYFFYHILWLIRCRNSTNRQCIDRTDLLQPDRPNTTMFSLCAGEVEICQ